MTRQAWTADERDDAEDMEWGAFHMQHPHRSLEAYLRQRRRARAADASPPVSRIRTPPKPVTPVTFLDKKAPAFDWRRANEHIAGMQDLSREWKSSQDTADIEIDSDEPIGIIFLSDAHIGDWATDHELFERITDEIMSIPNLYIALLGDMAAMNIKLRGVSEVAANLLPPEMQLAYYESWLDEVQDRVILTTWDNHAIEREEQGTGISAFKKLQSKYVPYFNGIGHPDVTVGDQTYKLAVSHRFRGRSIVNPCAGPMNYLIKEAHDREIAAQGDSHVPGVLQFTHGISEKVAINTGTTQLNSSYARRYFSLFTHATFPVLELHPDRHLAVPFWSVNAWVGSRG